MSLTAIRTHCRDHVQLLHLLPALSDGVLVSLLLLLFSFLMPLLGRLPHSAERETEEKEEEAERSAWHRLSGPCCLLWSCTSQASPGPWRADTSRPSSSLRGVDFLPIVTFPRGLCLLAVAPVLPAMAGDAGAGAWPVFLEAGSGQPPRCSQVGARADLRPMRSGRHRPARGTRLTASLGPLSTPVC